MVFFSALGCDGRVGAFFFAASSSSPISCSWLRPRSSRTLGNQSSSSAQRDACVGNDRECLGGRQCLR